MQPADTVITGARIWTGSPDPAGPLPPPPVEAAVALLGDRVVALGSPDDVLARTGPRTRRLHLPGRLVLPGFQDAHVHPTFAGRFRLHLSLHDLTGLDAYLSAVGAYAAAHPDRPWIFGAGWAPEALAGPVAARELLDRVVPDRPVFLFDTGIHSAWLNSRALALLTDTADPPHGRYRRDAEGRLTGILDENAAYRFEAAHVPAPDRAEWEAAILNAQTYLHSLGVTGWQDAWVTPATLDAYRSLADSGALTARVAAALWWERDQGLEQIDRFVEQRRSASRTELLDRTGLLDRTELLDRTGLLDRSGLLTRTVKIMVDGVIENGTGALLAPYHDACGGPGGPAANTGLSYLDPALLASAVTMLDRLDFQVHLHTIGDRAVRAGLDAVEAALRANGQRGNRHHLAHVQLVQPSDLGRFAAVGVTANCQAYWAQSDSLMGELTIPVLGSERARFQYPFADLSASGAVLAMGSDWSVSTPDPLQQIEVACTRTDPSRRSEPPFLPAQRLDLGTALRAFTAGSAYVNHDPSGGTIQVGGRADLVVLDRDVFSGSVFEIADAQAEYTVASGRIVHSLD